jgi:hypothetical protein
VLRDALAAGGDATDEAALAERAGTPVGSWRASRQREDHDPEDLRAAERAVAAAAPSIRIGQGYDLHRLVAGGRWCSAA